MNESAAEIFRHIRLHLVRAQRADVESRVADTAKGRDRSVEQYVSELEDMLVALLKLEYNGVLDEISDFLGAKESYRN